MTHLFSLPLMFALAVQAPGSPQVRRDTIPAWWRTGTCYEVFVRSFADSDGDGVGDLRGLTQRLSYVSDLGASCIWLMPIAQSPSYHGYDVTNYYEIERDYGTTADFKALVAEAHRRGIRIVVDMVLNHMSSDHPFFRSAIVNRDSRYRDWFLWSPVRRQTLNWGGPTWHKVEGRDEYYYGIFWQGMPDLNLHNAEVTAEWHRVARYWLDSMGVDGFRLDAVGHFFENGDDPRDGPGVHPWLRDYAELVRRTHPGAWTVGEIWDSIPQMQTFYPDQLDAYFAFPFADALIDAVRGGSARRLTSVVEQIQRAYPPGRWASFQRNHDQTRTMTEFAGDTAKARLSATILMTMPGIPFVYYGEELGMTGDKHHGDPRLRTPMAWRREPGVGFTTGTPWEPLQPDSFTANVSVMEGDRGSLLHHYRALIRLRNRTPSLGAAARFVALQAGSDSVLAYLRQGEGGTVLVVANLTNAARPGPVLASADSVMRAGRYAPAALMGRTPAALMIGRDGRIRAWTPLSSLGPYETLIAVLDR